MIQRLGFFLSQSENFFHPGRVWDIADHFLIRTGADFFLDGESDRFEVQTELLQDVDSDALA